jgi:hypothetical protein
MLCLMIVRTRYVWFLLSLLSYTDVNNMSLRLHQTRFPYRHSRRENTHSAEENIRFPPVISKVVHVHARKTRRLYSDSRLFSYPYRNPAGPLKSPGLYELHSEPNIRVVCSRRALKYARIRKTGIVESKVRDRRDYVICVS